MNGGYNRTVGASEFGDSVEVEIDGHCFVLSQDEAGSLAKDIQRLTDG